MGGTGWYVVSLEKGVAHPRLVNGAVSVGGHLKEFAPLIRQRGQSEERIFMMSYFCGCIAIGHCDWYCRVRSCGLDAERSWGRYGIGRCESLQLSIIFKQLLRFCDSTLLLQYVRQIIPLMGVFGAVLRDAVAVSRY